MANTVKRADIKNGSINASKIASGSVTADKLAANSIQAKHLSADAITAVQISAADIDAITVAASKISADNISANSIDGSKIKAGTITSDRFNTSALDAVNARITNLDAQTVSALSFKASNASINYLETNKATIADLTAANGKISKLTSDKADITQLNVEKGRIDSLTATKANISDLNVEKARIDYLTTAKATITNLDAEKARIDQLISGAITAGKVAAGGVGAGAIAAGVVTSTALSADFVLAKNVTSPNFNGSISNGVINSGTAGYCLDSATGSLIVNKLIAREGVISGKYIQTTSEGGFNVDSAGNLGIKVDDETLSISNGSVTIKQVPSTSVVVATKDINYIGGANYSYHTSKPSNVTYKDTSVSRLEFTTPILVWDALQDITGVELINSVKLNNLKLDVNYSNFQNLAATTELKINFSIKFSASANQALNQANTNTGMRYIAAILNPVLPLSTKSYFLNSLEFLNTGGSLIPASNRYMVLYASVILRAPNISDSSYITVSLPSDNNYSLIVAASGITNPSTKFFSGLVVSNDYPFTF